MPVRKQGGESEVFIDDGPSLAKLMSYSSAATRRNFNSVFLIAFVGESEIGWTSPSLAILLNKVESPIPMTETEGSWVVSVINIGRAVGGLIGAVDIELFGSKATVFHIGLVQVISLICLAVADSVTWILVSRFMAGVAAGILFISFPLYIGEIADPRIRGTLICTITNGMSMGYVVGLLMGTYLPIMTFALGLLAVTSLFLISFYWLPHSPHHLVRIDQMEEAATAIKWYQKNAHVPNELVSLQSIVKAKNSMTYTSLLKEFMLCHNRVALVKVIIMNVFLQLSGLYTVGFYMEIILKKAQVTVMEPSNAIIIISSIGLIGGWCAMYAVDQFGRKTVLITAVLGRALALIALALHYSFLEAGYDYLRLQWLIIISAIFLELFINFGILPVPSTILSEIFAPHVKNYCCCIARLISGLFAFVTTQNYQMMVDSLGSYIYWIYALIMILTAIFAATQIPETKGKSLQEIQNMLMKKS